MEAEQPYLAAFNRINEAMDRKGNRMLRQRGLTRSQAHLLLALRQSNGHSGTLKELEKQLHAAQSTVVGLVARAERKGLVKTFGDPNDRRVKHVLLTEQGRAKAEICRQDVEEADSCMAEPLSEAERKVFLAMLGRVMEHLEKNEQP